MQNTIQISGLRFDYKNRIWIAPKLWVHPRYGIGEIFDAVISSDGELWVIALDFGEKQRKIRQDKVSPYGSSVKELKLGSMLRIPKIEEIEQEFVPPLSAASQKPGRHISREELLRRLRD